MSPEPRLFLGEPVVAGPPAGRAMLAPILALTVGWSLFVLLVSGVSRS